MNLEKQKELEQLVADMKTLVRTEEWKTFCRHIRENIVPAHKEICVNSSFIRNTKEAENQAVLIEGLLEAIEEPQNVIDTNDDSPLKKICNACGRLLKR